MMIRDEYLTINEVRQAEIKIKGSRFIGTIAHVEDENEAKNFISEISKKYHDATHNCFAYVVGLPPHQISRFNDDGEPAGTAGQPILSVILGKNLNFVVVVVTRYFGGIKLGKGGLIRAYSDCTRTVLELCKIKKRYIYEHVQFLFPYDLTGAVMRTISQFNAKLKETQYTQDTRFHVRVRKSLVEDFKKQLIEVTSGKLTFL